MSSPEVRVLGPLEVVTGDGSTVALPSKQIRLLAALVVADGQACDAEVLVEAVWDGSPPASARNLVQVYVSQLRKALPPGIEIVTRGRGYIVEIAPGMLDAARFERLVAETREARLGGNAALAASLAAQALALWRGRAYGELAYEEFARAESERLEELRVVALEERLDARLHLGQSAEVLGEALALAAEHPYRERLHAHAMLALYRSGRQAEALEHYTVFRDRLNEELGLEPAPALRELQRRILQHDPALAGETARMAEAGGALPVPPSPLVGRKRELDELHALLARREARLIVLTGAGGSGKTRLGLEAARRAAAAYANGAALVELAPLRDPGLVVPTIARVLGIGEIPDDTALETLIATVSSQELLLLVDNAEHVRDAAPSFARLVAGAPRLTLLVTSRAVLHVSGEHVFTVLPLAEDDAVELFVQRARLLEPTFTRTVENDADLREICRRVDGLPLGVELAAARIRTLPPHRLRDRLDERLAVLTGGPRDLPARQQTLRQTVDWSVGLLGDRERAVFARLAIFPAGATLEAAEQVCAADLDMLAVLVDDHLVQREDTYVEPRFRMLETVREYALELLGADRPQIELAMAEYFARLADSLQGITSGETDWMPVIERLDPEIDNVRVALATAAADSQLQLRLAGSLMRYWWVRGSLREGLEWIEQALAADRGQATEARATALYSGAALAWAQGDRERAKSLGQATLPLAVQIGSTWNELSAHTILGIVATEEEQYDTARYHHGQSIRIKEELGIEPVVEKLNLGVVELDSGNDEAAGVLFEDVLDHHRRNGNAGGMGFALLNLGLVHYNLGDIPAAQRDFEEGRSCLEKVGFRQQVAFSLQGLAACAAREARFEEAARLLGHAHRELDEMGAPWDGFASIQVVAAETEARAALGDDAFESAFAGA